MISSVRSSFCYIKCAIIRPRATFSFSLIPTPKATIWTYKRAVGSFRRVCDRIATFPSTWTLGKTSRRHQPSLWWSGTARSSWEWRRAQVSSEDPLLATDPVSPLTVSTTGGLRSYSGLSEIGDMFNFDILGTRGTGGTATPTIATTTMCMTTTMTMMTTGITTTLTITRSEQM